MLIFSIFYHNVNTFGIFNLIIKNNKIFQKRYNNFQINLFSFLQPNPTYLLKTYFIFQFLINQEINIKIFLKYFSLLNKKLKLN